MKEKYLVTLIDTDESTEYLAILSPEQVLFLVLKVEINSIFRLSDGRYAMIDAKGEEFCVGWRDTPVGTFEQIEQENRLTNRF